MLAIHELLDRVELLYPDHARLSDLRRAYIDKDLSSIFRLLDERQSELGEVEELRKSCVEKNLHSIFRLVSNHSSLDQIEDLRKLVLETNLHSLFRLIEDEELRKILLEENIWSLWRWLEEEVNSEIVRGLKRIQVREINFDSSSMSRGQLQSKIWLVKTLKDLDLDLGVVFLCAGWYAILATVLFESGIKLDRIRSFDLDPYCLDIADSFNFKWKREGWRFVSVLEDILKINYGSHTWKAWSKINGSYSEVTDVPQTVINTSCEHIADFKLWYDKLPVGLLLVLQNNNYFEIQTHVNCVQSLEDMTKQCPMKEVYFSGSLELEKYTRFMLIGRK